MKLFEIFNTQHELVFRKGHNYIQSGLPSYEATFTVGIQDYLLAVSKIDKNSPFHRTEPHQPIDDNTWFVGFVTAEGQDDDLNELGHDALAVFSNVISGLDTLFKQINPSMLYVGASDKSPKKARIYKKIIKKYNGEIISTGTFVLDGDRKTYWVIKI